jgi:hypothetical protein
VEVDNWRRLPKLQQDEKRREMFPSTFLTATVEIGKKGNGVLPKLVELAKKILVVDL